MKREKSEHQTLVLSNDVLLPENNFGFSLTVFSLVPMRTRQKRFFSFQMQGHKGESSKNQKSSDPKLNDCYK